MKKFKFIMIAMLFCSLLYLVGCDLEIDFNVTRKTTNETTITAPTTQATTQDNLQTQEIITNSDETSVLFYVDENLYSYSVINKNTIVEKPANPEKEFYNFIGWSKKPDSIKFYDFDNVVYEKTVLYAVFHPDYAAITNEISTNLIKSVVSVYNYSYNKNFIGSTNGVISQGSGVIFYETDDNYYILTNNHVTMKAEGYSYQTITINDYCDNEYSGALIHELAEYDLAVVSFPKSVEVELLVAKMAEKDPLVDDEIISIGQPNNQDNTITYGNVLKYAKVQFVDTSKLETNIEFLTICHDAFINHGSSGGPIFNLNFEIIGINCGASYSNDGSFASGTAIPIEKVYEYLDEYIWS